MIEVTIKLIPGGDITQARVIGSMSLWNTGKPRGRLHQYEYATWCESMDGEGIESMSGTFKHKRGESLWEFLKDALLIMISRINK